MTNKRFSDLSQKMLTPFPEGVWGVTALMVAVSSNLDLKILS